MDWTWVGNSDSSLTTFVERPQMDGLNIYRTQTKETQWMTQTTTTTTTGRVKLVTKIRLRRTKKLAGHLIQTTIQTIPTVTIRAKIK